MKEVRCSDCKNVYPLNHQYWNKNRASKTGYQNVCRKCVSIRRKKGYKKKRLTEYALYAGDEMLQIGTVKEIAEAEGMKELSVRYLMTPSYKKRCKGSGRRELFKLEEDYDDGEDNQVVRNGI